MLKTIEATASYIGEHIQGNVEVGIILGSGLGGLVNEITIEKKISYKEIPNFGFNS